MRAAPLILALLALAAPSLPGAPFAKGGVLGVGAREAGQGGAVVASEDGATALWWNPAGLDADPRFDVALSYGSGLDQQLFDTAFSHRGVLPGLEAAYGLGARHVGSAPALDQEEYALALAFPFSDDGRVLTGFAVRALQAKVADIDASGYGVDLGLRWHPALAGGRLSLGLAARDLQAGLQWPAGPPDDPMQLFQAGASWALGPNSSVEFDSEVGNDPSGGGTASEGFKVGGERWWNWPTYGFKRFMALRLGYLQDSAQGPTSLGGQFSGGLGLAAQGLRVDYSWTQGPATQGPVQRVALSYDLGPVSAAPTPAPLPPAAAPLAPSLGLEAQPSRLDPERSPGGVVLRVRAAGLTAAARSRFTLAGPKGDVVAARDGLAPAESYSWDPGPGPAAAGGYRAELTVWDAAGATLASAQARFEVLAPRRALGLVPEAGLFAPLAQSARPQAFFRTAYDGADAARWTLSVAAAGQTRALRVLSGPGLPPRLAWNGRDHAGKRVVDGDYRVVLQLLRRGGDTLTAQADVAVDTRRPDLDLEAQPRVFNPAGALAAVTFRPALLGGGGIPVRWTLQVQALDGHVIKGFTGKGTPPATLPWNGEAEAGKTLAPGSLCYADLMVETESGAQARLPRLALSARLADPKLPFQVPLKTVRFGAGDEVVGLDDFKALKEAATEVKQTAKDYVVQVLGRAAPGESGRDGLGELELSYLRARAVRDYLVESEGLDPARVQACGLGAEEKQAPGQGGERERRVDVVLHTR